MASNASLGRQAWRPWSVVLPASLATAVCLLLGTVGWLVVELQAAAGCLMDCPGPPNSGGSSGSWLTAGGLGQWVLTAAVITLGILGRRRPGSRLSGAIFCWLAIPLAVGWFALCLTSS